MYLTTRDAEGPVKAPPNAPLDDRKNDITISLTVVTVLSTFFVLWRLIVCFRSKKKFVLCDYLIIIAAALNIVGNVFSIMSGYNGQGRHAWDPSITKEMLKDCLKYIFVSQAANLFAMAFLKASIAAYLLSLNFSRTYRIIIWITVVLVATNNFIIPAISLFPSCQPLSLRWDRNQPGWCWPRTVNVVSGFIQSATNILTDIIYSCAPLVYLSMVQLPKRTQWGLRAVFLLGLLGTACSIAKLFDLNALLSATDASYDSVNLTIWSASEVSTGIIVSSLPHLRKTFDSMMKRVFPSTHGSSNVVRSSDFKLPSSEHSRAKSNMSQSDGRSDHSLPHEDMDEKDGIFKTTKITIQNEHGNHHDYKDNWISPHSSHSDVAP